MFGKPPLGGDGPCIDFGAKLGCGVVFALTPPEVKGDAWTEQILHFYTNGAGGGMCPRTWCNVTTQGQTRRGTEDEGLLAVR